MKKWPIIFCDMDGVLCDLFNHVAEIHDVDHYNEMTKTEWEHFLKNTDPYQLFSNLPAFSTSNQLLLMVKNMFGGYCILSSPLNYDLSGSIAGKRKWLETHITVPADDYIFEHEKWKYAVQENGTPNILIDDWKKNIIPWREHGGIAIKYQADEDSLEYLREQLSEARSLFL